MGDAQRPVPVDRLTEAVADGVLRAVEARAAAAVDPAGVFGAFVVVAGVIGPYPPYGSGIGAGWLYGWLGAPALPPPTPRQTPPT